MELSGKGERKNGSTHTILSCQTVVRRPLAASSGSRFQTQASHKTLQFSCAWSRLGCKCFETPTSISLEVVFLVAHEECWWLPGGAQGPTRHCKSRWLPGALQEPYSSTSQECSRPDRQSYQNVFQEIPQLVPSAVRCYHRNYGRA